MMDQRSTGFFIGSLDLLDLICWIFKKRLSMSSPLQCVYVIPCSTCSYVMGVVDDVSAMQKTYRTFGELLIYY